MQLTPAQKLKPPVTSGKTEALCEEVTDAGRLQIISAAVWRKSELSTRQAVQRGGSTLHWKLWKSIWDSFWGTLSFLHLLLHSVK